MHIIGTAGHVDHGKSSLVQSLTGHNPDRFIEERERGMTLDLGFAPLRFADGMEAGIIDVPGHERFLHNMLAGAAGMELLLLVIAATEGPKPQTREHLCILNYLNVQRAIVVLTKADLVDEEELEIATALSLEACEGTVAENAPVIAVSNKSGEGIEELKAAIHEAILLLPPRRDDAPPYLPVDRVFALQGHGTVLTGTLMQGAIRIGDVLALQPSGLAARVRNLQVFGRKREAVSGGSRVAVNVAGIEAAAIGRGEVLAARREFSPVKELDVEFSALPETLGTLRRRTPVRAHIGSAEVLGRIQFANGVPQTSEPVRARLKLSKPVVYYPGSRLVLRGVSPKHLLGGAVARAGAGPAAIAYSQAAVNSPAGAGDVFSVVRDAGLAPMNSARIAARANTVLHAAETALHALVESRQIVRLKKPVEYIDRAAFESAYARVRALITERQKRAPWQAGCTITEISTALGAQEPLGARLVQTWQEEGDLVALGRFWQLPGFYPRLTAQQTDYLNKALHSMPESALLPCSLKALLQDRKAVAIAGLEGAVESLLALGLLVRIGDDIYRKAQVEMASSILKDMLHDGSNATMAQVRDAFATSRKYALPLLEYFDGTGLTVRDGDLRRLRNVP